MYWKRLYVHHVFDAVAAAKIAAEQRAEHVGVSECFGV